MTKFKIGDEVFVKYKSARGSNGFIMKKGKITFISHHRIKGNADYFVNDKAAIGKDILTKEGAIQQFSDWLNKIDTDSN